MKSMFKAFAAVVVFAVAACGGGNAHAQAIDLQFDAPAASVSFNLSRVRSVEKLTGFVNVTFANGRSSQSTSNPATPVQITDTGAVWTAITADAQFLANFVRVGTTDKYYNVNALSWVACHGGSSRAAYDALTAGSDVVDNTCAFYNDVKARSN